MSRKMRVDLLDFRQHESFGACMEVDAACIEVDAYPPYMSQAPAPDGGAHRPENGARDRWIVASKGMRRTHQSIRQRQ